MQQSPIDYSDESLSRITIRQNLERVIDNWIDQQPGGNILNLQIAKDRMLNFDSQIDDFLDLSNLGLINIPPISYLGAIPTINLSNNQLTYLDEHFSLLSDSLRVVNLSNNQFFTVPTVILNMPNILHVEMSNNPIVISNDLRFDFVDFEINDAENRLTLVRQGNNFSQDETLSSINQLDNSGYIFDENLNISNENNDSFLSLSSLDHHLDFNNESIILPISNDSNFFDDEISIQLDSENDELINFLNISIDSVSSQTGTSLTSNNFLSMIIRDADFYPEELSANANGIFGITHLSDQILSSNLIEIENLFTISNQVRSNDLLANFLQRILSSETSYKHEDQGTKKIISRQILKILNLVNYRKNDEYFMNGIEMICLDGLDRCGDMAYLNLCNLYNFSHAKSSNEIDIMFDAFLLDEKTTSLGKRKIETISTKATENSAIFDSTELLRELKLQASYNYILNLAKLRCEKIRNNQISEGVDFRNLFSEDAEVYLNYMRFFNVILDQEKLECRIPSIKTQRYFDISIYQPNTEEIRSLVDILKSVDSSQIAKFLAENIRNNNMGAEGNVIDKTKIYLAINLAVNEIATEYLIDSEDNSVKAKKRADEIIKIQRQIVTEEFEEIFLKLLANQPHKLSFSEDKMQSLDARIKNDIALKMQEHKIMPTRSPLATMASNRVLQTER